MQKDPYTLPAALMIGCFVVVFGAMTHAQEDTPAIPDESAYDEAKGLFEDAWRDAAVRFKRSAELESTLYYYDRKVDEAETSLKAAAQRKSDVRGEIEDARKNIAELRVQLDQLHASHTDRREALEDERAALRDYVRLVAGRDIADNGAGVMRNVPIVAVLTSGSLGENVEQSLYRDALINTRADVFTRLLALEEESGTAIRELQRIALTLGVSLLDLQEQSKELDVTLVESHEDLLEQVRTRDLTEAQLETIRETVAEVNARVVDAQQSLSRIATQLKEAKQEQYLEEMESAQEERRTLAAEERTLALRREELLAVKAAAKEAYDAMRAQKNQDRRHYQRVEEIRAGIESSATRIKHIDQELAVELPEDAPRETHIDRDKLSKERATIERTIAFQERMLTHVEQGYAPEKVEEYLRSYDKAVDADLEIRGVDARMAVLAQESAAVDGKIAAIEANKPEIDDALGSFSVFTWPVYGPITAGFYDSSYEKFFGVPHRGIDIAVAQGTPVYSIAEGVVITARNGGRTGYSYVLIGHNEGYTSLYGHLSQIYVSAGDVLEHGQVIGLSGGRPGTAGAGLMTTGPHVHLEIHKNGAYLNPFQVLLTGE